MTFQEKICLALSQNHLLSAFHTAIQLVINQSHIFALLVSPIIYPKFNLNFFKLTIYIFVILH
jgi:hypothetical protein